MEEAYNPPAAQLLVLYGRWRGVDGAGSAVSYGEKGVYHDIPNARVPLVPA